MQASDDCICFLPPAPHAFYFLFFFLNDTATTEIYTLSLHDALLISAPDGDLGYFGRSSEESWTQSGTADRKSTRLNSSHMSISYAVFCLKKKKHEAVRPALLMRQHPGRHHLNQDRPAT